VWATINRCVGVGDLEGVADDVALAVEFVELDTSPYVTICEHGWQWRYKSLNLRGVA